MINLPVKLSEAKESFSVFFIELYVFHLVTGNLCLAACDEKIDWYIPGTTTPVSYLPYPIQRENVKSSVDSKRDNVSLKVSNVDDIFTSALFNSYDFRGRPVTIIQILYPDSLTDSTCFRYVTTGDIDSPVFNEKDKTFSLMLVSKMPNTENGRITQAMCNSEFGDDSCGKTVDIQTGTVQSNSDQYNIFIEQSAADNYWQNGTITCGYETRMIYSSTGNKITLHYPFSQMPTGNYSIRTNCNKTTADCDKWDNRTSFTGFLSVPFEYSIRV